jgi:hypothetical protein
MQRINARKSLLQESHIVIAGSYSAAVNMHQRETRQREEEVDAKTEIVERRHMHVPAHDVGVDRAVMQQDAERGDKAKRVERDVSFGGASEMWAHRKRASPTRLRARKRDRRRQSRSGSVSQRGVPDALLA